MIALFTRGVKNTAHAVLSWRGELNQLDFLLLLASSCTKVRDGVDSTNTPNSSHVVIVAWGGQSKSANHSIENLVRPKRGMVNTNVIRAAIALSHVLINKEH